MKLAKGTYIQRASAARKVVIDGALRAKAADKAKLTAERSNRAQTDIYRLR